MRQWQFFKRIIVNEAIVDLLRIFREKFGENLPLRHIAC